MLRQLTGKLARSISQSPSHTKSQLRYFRNTSSRLQMFGEAGPATFEEHVVQGQKLTIVDFHADWCPPCKMLDPILQRVMAQEHEVDYLKIDTDKATDLAAKYKIASLPTVVAFKHGKEYSRFVGLVNEEAVRNFIANLRES
ncbi:MAG: hypothetical protein CYPHOPRED_000566 [Cyphobasidiales sp. Tagirdzhanova-0007]|nr:MAG: hypothetical protein CYPHOPRED_000566 [Cyphobasidiales sp. Tagirdzhanova-0007]